MTEKNKTPCTYVPEVPKRSKVTHDDVDHLAATLPPVSTGKEAAAILGLSPGYLANLRTEGKGPAYLKPNKGRVLYTAKALATWMLAA